MTPEQKAALTLFGDAEFKVNSRHREYRVPGAEGTRITYDDLVGIFRGFDIQGIAVTFPAEGA